MNAARDPNICPDHPNTRNTQPRRYNNLTPSYDFIIADEEITKPDEVLTVRDRKETLVCILTGDPGLYPEFFTENQALYPVGELGAVSRGQLPLTVGRTWSVLKYSFRNLKRPLYLLYYKLKQLHNSDSPG